MTDVVSSVRQIIQDLVAPDLKALQSKLDSQAKQLDMLNQHSTIQHDATMKVLEAFRAEMRSEFAALKALNQVEVMRQVSPLSERIAIVERR
jgi:hypothetical protein